ncbi:MAG: prenyltransferase [Syntrophales bacterium]
MLKKSEETAEKYVLNRKILYPGRSPAMRLNISITSAQNDVKRSAFSIWFQAVRFHFVPPSFLPAILCGVIGWSRLGVFDLPSFLLVIAGVTINHFGLNMLDDVFDYRHAVDYVGGAEKNPYTGGSGVLTEGLLSTRQMLAAVVVCFAVTAAIGFYLAFIKGWPVVVLGMFGLFCSIFYTVPPIKFGYRGLGELSMIVNFGPVIGLGSYYVQTREFSAEPLLVSLVLGFMMWSMLIINEIPDYEADRRGQKWNLVARFGKKTGVVLYIAGLSVSYAIIIASVAIRVAPFPVLLGLATLPLALKSILILKKHSSDGLKMAPANISMIKVHFLTGLSLICGYILDGILNSF